MIYYHINHQLLQKNSLEWLRKGVFPTIKPKKALDSEVG